jgi:hypothetical protein
MGSLIIRRPRMNASDRPLFEPVPGLAWMGRSLDKLAHFRRGMLPFVLLS